MTPITTERLKELLSTAKPPCLSLYQPTHRGNPDNRQDHIRFKNLVAEAESSLKEAYKSADVSAFMSRFHALRDDQAFWTYQLDGLAILADAERFEVFHLPRSMPELAVVADTFHIKPLLRHTQATDRFQVLCLDRGKVKMFEGDRYGLAELELGKDFPATLEQALGDEQVHPRQPFRSAPPHSSGSPPGGGHGASGTGPTHGHGGASEEEDKDIDRYFRAVDREVARRFSNPTGLPLVLAALPQYHKGFREGSHNTHLIAEGVERNPMSLSPDQLRAEVWQVVLPRFQARLKGLKNDYESAFSRGAATDDLDTIAREITTARVGTLMVDADAAPIPGRFDKVTGEVRRGDMPNPKVNDVLDDLAAAVLTGGGHVLVLGHDDMPTPNGLAALYRY